MKFRGILIALAFVASVGLSAAPARAEIRSATVTDPADATPPLSGPPNSPDVKQVRATYDTAGSFSFVVDFYNSLTDLSFNPTYAHYGQFDIGSSCEVGAYGGITGQHHVASSSTTFNNEFSVSGYSGTLEVQRTVSPDGRQITISGQTPAIANQDYVCFDYTLGGRDYSTYSNPHSDYDENCGCWYTGGAEDWLGESFYDDAFYFDGFAPPPHVPPAVPPPGCGEAKRRLHTAERRVVKTNHRLQQTNSPDLVEVRRKQLKRARANVKRLKQKVTETC